jgi:hypothetical protein
MDRGVESPAEGRLFAEFNPGEAVFSLKPEIPTVSQWPVELFPVGPGIPVDTFS